MARVDFAIGLALTVAQAMLAGPLVAGSFTRWRQSIEAAYIADARFIVERFPDLSWNPFWYLGFPFELFYTPLLPGLVAIVGAASGDIGAAYRLVSAIGFALGPAALYALARSIGRSRGIALLASALFACAPSLSLILPGVREDVTAFIGSPVPWRLVVLVEYGEGPHVLGLSLALLATAALARYLSTGRGFWVATLLFLAVALTNLIALLGAAVLAFGTVATSGAFARGLRVGAAVTLLALVWYSPGFVVAVGEFSSGGATGGAFLLFPLVLVVATLAARAGGAVAFWCVAFGAVVAARDFFGVTLAPQPSRYAIELDAVAALALADLGARALARLPRRELALVGAAAIVLVAALPGWLAARPRMAPDPEWRSWSEREVALWLRDHLRTGERAYLSGSHSFWLDVFADVPQVRGGVDFAATDPWWAHASYQINSGADPDLSVSWLRALAVRYVVVTGPESRDAYRDYVRPEMFDGRLPLAATVQGARIYAVDAVHAGPTLVATGEPSPPRNASDAPAIRRYLAALDAGVDGGVVDVAPLGSGAWSGTVTTRSSATLLLRVAYDVGWHARLDEREIAPRRDDIGLLAVDLPPGAHRVRIEHLPHADRIPGLALAIAFAIASGVRGVQSARRAHASISPTSIENGKGPSRSARGIRSSSPNGPGA